MLKALAISVLLLIPAQVYAGEACKVSTQKFISDSKSFQPVEIYSKASPDKANLITFFLIYSHLTELIGSEPPYSIDQFIVFNATDSNGGKIVTLSAEGDKCHRKYWVINDEFLERLKKDDSI